ncbi:uncharacterized protein LOC9646683 [Selaginella moellendorffii]|uniref:uncharacterized protein LOC9646683 n=1 Tax=Selaginella moellendorffii TaxID=88036 RepID=UPI000D1CEDB0|nr:uncharacterized protein LOC9646683 [Selaginella moellendorffii]XP_024530099.1 uncharacterized protein LOC9646683 [Selaginella moellendorffii]|eukprot:XP_024530097.1 uncharacterized protein LOC9646683 [Selaginella moellendorffii]
MVLSQREEGCPPSDPSPNRAGREEGILFRGEMELDGAVRKDFCTICKSGGKVARDALEEPLSRFSNYWKTEAGKKAEEDLMKHYLVKWKSRSYLHCSWIPLNEMERASRLYHGLRMKMNQFHKTCEAMKQCPTRVE